MAENRQFYARPARSGKSVAIVGAGPAGLACAHRLATHGHDVTIYEAKKKAGGLNEFGIAAYKTVEEFAQKEIDYVTAIGGIDIEYGKRLGKHISVEKLRGQHDAVFLGMGLAGVNGLDCEEYRPWGCGGRCRIHCEVLRQAKNKARLPVGRNIVVIGGGMTAIDAAVQAKLLGAETVTICYRRGRDRMNASAYEQELATSRGVTIRCWMQPRRLIVSKGDLKGIELEYTDAGERQACRHRPDREAGCRPGLPRHRTGPHLRRIERHGRVPCHGPGPDKNGQRRAYLPARRLGRR